MSAKSSVSNADMGLSTAELCGYNPKSLTRNKLGHVRSAIATWFVAVTITVVYKSIRVYVMPIPGTISFD